MNRRWLAWALLPVLSTVALAWQDEGAAEKKKKPDFPKFEEVSEGYTKVVSTLDGSASLYTIWTRAKDGQMLAELPRGYANQKHYIALTSPTGEMFAGLQRGEQYVYWKRFDKRMALIEPQIETRSTGDTESKDSVQTVYTDKVVVDVPILCMGPGGQPVIDMDALLVGKASTFYGSSNNMQANLTTIAKAKAFPQNVELAFEGPTSGGTIKTIHYSISVIPDNTAYKPRKADERVGYFTTSFKDLGVFRSDRTWDRTINRWHLEKADASLKMSPAKEPIVFYLEHTVPVRYRRYVKQGILSWNEAFEQVGISDAMVVHYQDKTTGAHMDKDPEDVRYNFVRWISNDIGTAIGPSRAHPLTGQILDADIVLTDGWIRAFWYMSHDNMPQIAMEGFSEETMRWLDENPQWDPRVRLAAPNERDQILAEREKRRLMGPVAYELAFGDSAILANADALELAEQLGPEASLCMASNAKAESMAMMNLTMEILGLFDDEEGEEGEEGEEEIEKIDGIPEWFIGPSLADLVAHEVGHTLGLRHNFRASGIYSFEEINSEEFKGKKPFSGSVMDYLPVNAVFDDEGNLKGDHAMIGVGPYDMWAIEYGYTFDDPVKVLERVAEPELQYLTDEDASGPDPLARRRDLASDPLVFAENQMDLVRMARGRILEDFVKDGDSWSRSRYGYEITLRNQTSSVSMMANWLGGSFVHRDRKGDPDGRAPIETVPADAQRAALSFVIANSFFDEAFGLTPELLARMTVDKWYDGGGRRYIREDPTFPIHDRIAGAQASALTMMMTPTTLRRVYDNELFSAASEDVLTLPELLDTITASVWQEVGYTPAGSYTQVTTKEASSSNNSSSTGFTVRQPMISSLRRNLQREHVERLIDLSLKEGNTASTRTISLLSRQTLQDLNASIETALGGSPDAYTRAHLGDAHTRIHKALDASYTYGGNSSGGGSPFVIRFGKDEQ